MKKLLVILLTQTIFLINCSSVSSQPVVLAQPSSFPTLAYARLRVIDKDNPPREGLWISWADSRSFAMQLQNERLEWQKMVFRQKREYDLERLKCEFAERQMSEISGNYPGFWSKWGFTIGLGLGIIIGVSAAVIVVNSIPPRGQ